MSKIDDALKKILYKDKYSKANIKLAVGAPVLNVEIQGVGKGRGYGKVLKVSKDKALIKYTDGSTGWTPTEDLELQ